MLIRSFFLACTAIVAVHCSAAPLTPEQTKFFETKIRPVLVKECYGCHSSKAGAARGGLRLDNQRLMQLGGDSGASIVPGDLEESLLFNAITHEDFVMPPKRKLSNDIIEDFRQWILMGAPDPRVTEIAEIKSTISTEDIDEAKDNFWAYQHPTKPVTPTNKNSDWARTEIDHFVLNKLEEAHLQPSDDADSYKVLRRLCFDLVGLPPTAEQIEYFNQRWQHDPDEAIKLVVDRLLDMPQYGERWGRHWLDVARYAESTGREVNQTFPHAWRYRDYVIESFNDDKPFDRFVQEQIAGDLLPVDSDEQWAENLIATGFLAMGTKNINENNGRQFAADLVDEQIDTTTRVFLGTSVACARCHDHKFDAIPQTDYYAMAGIFASTRTYFGNPPSKFGSFAGLQTKRQSSLILLPIDDPNPFDKSLSQAEMREMESQISDLSEEIAASRRQRNSPNNGTNPIINFARLSSQRALVSAKLAVVDDNGNPRSYCMGVQDAANPADTRLLVRGEVDELGQVVQRGFPQVLSDHSTSISGGSSGRLELAQWIGSDDNPLTARVMVNRIWQHLVGQGIVKSTENFGVTGQAPSHPELLDYLAVQFVKSGWSVKTVIREITKSRVYRISSQYDQKKFEYNPDNELLWRANPRRLDAEALRDAMLSIAGTLDTERPRASDVAKAGYVRVRNGRIGDPRDQLREAANKMSPTSREMFQQRFQQMRGGGGRPSSNNGQRPGMSGRRSFSGRPSFSGREGQTPEDARRMYAEMQKMRKTIEDLASKQPLDVEDAKYRSVYMPVVRDEVPRSLYVFDFAEPSMVIGTRESSNTPNQSLYMMNNPFVIGRSQEFADRLVNENSTASEQIKMAFVLAYGRQPTSGERAATAKFLSLLSNGSRRKVGESTLAVVCQSLFAAAEFRYID